MFFPKCCFPVAARVRKDHMWASWPQKRQKETLLAVEIFLIRTSILPPHQHPCILSPPGWILLMQMQLKSPPSLHCPKKPGPAPALFKHTASSRILSLCVILSSKSQQKINCTVYQLGFDTGWKGIHSFFLYYFAWDQAAVSSTVLHWNKNNPCIFQVEQRQHTCPCPPPDSRRDLGHAVTKQGSSNTHVLGQDKLMVTFRWIKTKNSNCSI